MLLLRYRYEVINIETMGERIKRLRIERKMTQEELGSKFGLKRAAINKYEKGNVENMKRSIIEDMSRFFNVTPSYLMALDANTSSIETIYNQLNELRQKKVYNYAERQLEEQNSKVTSIEEYKKDDCFELEVIAKVSAGKGVYNFLECEPRIAKIANKSIPDADFDYTFEVSGDSMEPTFKDGELIFVIKDDNVRNGQIGVVEIDFELFVKKMYLEDGRLRLVSLNTSYDDITADGTNEINVIGKVVM